MTKLTIGELFAGIGGFSLGLESTGGFETKWFVEIDEFCNKVLAKNYPNVKRYKDVKEVHGIITHTDNRRCPSDIREEVSKREETTKPNTESCGRDTGGDGVYRQSNQCPNCLEPVDLICGGVPCQPASCAGKRRGTQDDRWLWHEAIRVIGELKPSWCILENVTGILSLQGGLPFEQVCVDLENQGYEVQPVIIPACAKNAPHRRDRIWIVAHTESMRPGRRGTAMSAQRSGILQGEQAGRAVGCEVEGCACKLTNDDRDSKRTGQQGGINRQGQVQFRGTDTGFGNQWSEDWYEVAASLCRVDARISNRVDRLKCLGNAVVPQVVAEIGKAILDLTQTQGA